MNDLSLLSRKELEIELEVLFEQNAKLSKENKSLRVLAYAIEEVRRNIDFDYAPEENQRRGGVSSALRTNAEQRSRNAKMAALSRSPEKRKALARQAARVRWGDAIDAKAVGEQIRNLRQFINVTQSEFATELETYLGVGKAPSQSTVASWESGKAAPSNDFRPAILALAAALDYPFEIQPLIE